MPSVRAERVSDLEVQDLLVLLTVAETGSFRRAALRLGIGQPAVSRRIRKLEDGTGVSLFERRRSGAVLTSAGAYFSARARAIVDDIEAALVTTQSAAVADTGHLRIGLIASLSHGALREVVARFLTRHPEVNLCFAETDRSELLTLLSHRTIDIVVAAGEPSSDVGESLLLVREPIYLAVSSENLLAARDRLSWDDVTGSRFVVSAREPGPEIHDYIVRRVSDLGRRARVERHRLGREGIMNLVGLGLGVSLVADHWRGVSYPNVVFVPIGDEDERVPFSLTWRPENDNPALRRFLSLARAAAKGESSLAGIARRPDPSP